MIKRIGHKGADALAPGNTAESLRAAATVGVDLIEFDVIRHPRDDGLVLAHDAADALAREAGSLLTLDEGLALLASEEFAGIGLDVDLKRSGYELELLAALREHELTARTTVTTMELSSIELLRAEAAAAELRLGLTIPHVTRDWLNAPAVVKPAVGLGLLWQRLQQPPRVARLLQRGVIDLVMAFHMLVTPRLVESVQAAGGEIWAWTVDDAETIKRLSSLGVTGVVSNDPRLFATI